MTEHTYLIVRIQNLSEVLKLSFLKKIQKYAHKQFSTLIIIIVWGCGFPRVPVPSFSGLISASDSFESFNFSCTTLSCCIELVRSWIS